jgi:hypothetical protein
MVRRARIVNQTSRWKAVRAEKSQSRGRPDIFPRDPSAPRQTPVVISGLFLQAGGGRGGGEEEEKRKRRGRGEEEERMRRGRGEEEERKRRGEEEERKREMNRSGRGGIRWLAGEPCCRNQD